MDARALLAAIGDDTLGVIGFNWELDHAWIELLVEWLREIAAGHAETQPGLAEQICKEADYFETNKHRMQLPGVS